MHEHLEKAYPFLLNHARIIDRRVFEAVYLGGPREVVADALAAYRNPDGGFGHGLEADKRDPHSQPVDTRLALEYLDMAGLLQDPGVQQRLVLPACDFLQSISTPAGGVPRGLPSASNYPHAPWWQIEENPPAELNPTAELVGLLRKAGINHPWVDQAESYCWRELETFESEWYHDIMPVVTFLSHAGGGERVQREIARIKDRVSKPGVVELDPDAGGYVKMPLDWAPSPGSPLRELFDDQTVQQHLRALAARQQADGGWPINWDAISQGVELEWRGLVTLNALQTLSAYGVIQQPVQAG